MYQTASKVVREARRPLKERNEFRDRNRKLRRDARAGIDEIDRGEFTEFDAKDGRRVAGRVKSRGMKRLAEQRKTGAR